MKVSSRDWTWTFAKMSGVSCLGLNVVLDSGNRYFFKSHFTSSDLRSFPGINQPFSISDARMLTDYLDGLNAIGLCDDDEGRKIGISMEVGLNAVACARFVRGLNPLRSGFFLSHGCHKVPYRRGSIVTLYTVNGGVADFMILDDEPVNGMYRLMLLNSKWELASYILRAGSQLRAVPEIIYPYRQARHQHQDHARTA